MILSPGSSRPAQSDRVPSAEQHFKLSARSDTIYRICSIPELFTAVAIMQLRDAGKLRLPYGNLGLTLLGEIVAERSGQPYERYVEEHILKPRRLADTHTELPESLRGSRLATGYSARKRDGSRDKQSFFQARGLTAAFGFSPTVEDLARDQERATT